MAQLFSKTTIQDHIKIFDGIDISKQIKIVTDLYADHKKGLTKDETRYEQRFNGQFFGALLGYEESKNRHPKASTPVGGKIADLGLGLFSDEKYSYEGVRVIVELKGSTASLDKKQASYGGQTPVDQGFGYKTSFSQDTRLVVSNFTSIRLYKDNKQDYEIWTLEELASGENNWYELKKILLLMQKKNLISTSNESYTQKLLSKFRYDQEQISKKFYAEYKALRLELINDIRSRNEGVTIDLVVEKAQKLIDRVIFIHFCEDKGLLPADKLKEVIEFGEKALSPTFQTLSNFFEAVNSGSPKLEIPNGYNGGLFHTDPELDTLQVGDKICRKFIDLGLYDFDGELSVNILGHIFEQSISDLEQLKIDLLGTETESDQLVETKTSKRKKDGIFYTPEYIVDYIIQHSLMTRLEEKENECLAKVGKKRNGYKDEKEAYLAYQAILQSVKVLDPACGSGAFLVKVFDYLYTENKRIAEIVGSLFQDDAIYKNILRDNIYGVDLNAESVEITKLSLWLKSAQKGKKLNNLDKNIKCGNSLIDDPEVAGDKAFLREKEFENIMKSGGFDVVVGNPPYVLVQPSNTDKKALDYYKLNYNVASYKIDLYHLFYEKSIDVMNKKGLLGFITPNTFLTNKHILPLRKYILDKTAVRDIVVFDNGVFVDASVDTAIIMFSKSGDPEQFIVNKMNKYGSIEGFNKIDQNDWKLDQNMLFNLFLTKELIFKDTIELGTIASVTFGLQTKDKKTYVSEEKKGDDRENCYTGKDISRYHLSGPNLYFKNNFQEVKAGGSRNMDIHHSRKIVVRQVGNPEPLYALDDNGYATLNTMYSIIPNAEYSIKYLLCILSSSLLKKYWLSNYSDNKVTFPKVKGFQLKSLPIRKKFINEQQPFVEKADHMLTLTGEYHAALQQTLDLLQSEYKLEKIPKKLQKFTEIDFDNFKKVLKIKKLSLTEKEELMIRFTNKHSMLSDLQSQIDTLDREIDEMVFDLYGLNEEEREIVLAG